MALLQPGMPAPDFSGTAVGDGGEFVEISSSYYKDNGKYVVLLFYPLDFTFVGPSDVTAFNDRAEEFKEKECEVIAVSTDSVFCHLAYIERPREQGGLGKTSIPLLADRNHQISSKYGVLEVNHLVLHIEYYLFTYIL